MGFMGPDADSGANAADEYLRRKRIREGTEAIESQFAGFDKPFYDKRAAAYEGYAMPQLDDQYTKAAEDLKLALARQYGTLDSSEYGKRSADLAEKYALGKSGIAQQGQQYAQSAQSAVEGQRSSLLGQLQQTADPAASASASLRASSLLNQQDSFQPLGDLFYNVTEGLAANSPTEGIIPISRGTSGGKKGSPYKYSTA
jgi:hypothetical protein